MNAPLITMNKDQALKKLRAFRADRHKDAEEVYRRTEQAYAALAEGTPLLSLTAAIRAGGFFDGTQLPKLAVARADRREVYFHWIGGTRASYFAGAIGRSPPSGSNLELMVDMGVQHQKWSAGYALVPMVPADVRPATGQLRDWFVLWEVPRWFDRSQSMQAPHDPLLLKHVGGDLYAVLAQWDLTDVERLVLEGVRRR